MGSAALIPDILLRCGEELAEKTAFINRDGSSFSFAELLRHSRFIASELLTLGFYGRAAAVMGEVNYTGLAAMFGCAMAGIAFVPLDASLSENEQKEIISRYGISGIFYSSNHRERAEALSDIMPEVFMFPEVEDLLGGAELNENVSLPKLSPDEPAFLFFTSENGKAAVLSHKNICETLRAVASTVDISSYIFLSPQAWGKAFDCVMGLLLPLYAGCSVVKRGERRSVAKAISESSATALTCTPERLLSLEKALKTKSEKTRSKAVAIASDFFGVLLHSIGFDLRKQMHRKIHALMGDQLKMIICGGGYPDKDNLLQFATWGFSVYDCYFLTECGAAAISRFPEEKPYPLAEISSAAEEGCGELTVSGASVAMGYFGEADGFNGTFRTGDMGVICEDGTLDIKGKRRTMLMSGSDKVFFPEEISAKLCRNKYISRCSVSGRFDTRTAEIVVSAVITPDFKEVVSAIGSKYSENRLRLLIKRELEKLSPSLPHKIDEFVLTGKKLTASEEVSNKKNERK